MRIFWNKNEKITSAFASGGWTPHVITPAYYCKSVEIISSAKCVLLTFKKENYNSKYSAFASSAAFALIFYFTLYSFC